MTDLYDAFTNCDDFALEGPLELELEATVEEIIQRTKPDEFNQVVALAFAAGRKFQHDQGLVLRLTTPAVESLLSALLAEE